MPSREALAWAMYEQDWKRRGGIRNKSWMVVSDEVRNEYRIRARTVIDRAYEIDNAFGPREQRLDEGR